MVGVPARGRSSEAASQPTSSDGIGRPAEGQLLVCPPVADLRFHRPRLPAAGTESTPPDAARKPIAQAHPAFRAYRARLTARARRSEPRAPGSFSLSTEGFSQWPSLLLVNE